MQFLLARFEVHSKYTALKPIKGHQVHRLVHAAQLCISIEQKNRNAPGVASMDTRGTRTIIFSPFINVNFLMPAAGLEYFIVTLEACVVNVSSSPSRGAELNVGWKNFDVSVYTGLF